MVDVELPGRLSEFDHPSWFAGVWTAVAYGLILLGMFLALFVVPYLVFTVLPVGP